ncbi:hypothetical protein VMCG_04243 [Cytospora schulzeri]|uniref:Uncharacterized protein n=1 Tax=Cytospora schulzeri TaxID=448051 RepID=A0A423WSV6_9PEZI|nr:hypothetical protein VMCG_04243 [Valsa malicola]
MYTASPGSAGDKPLRFLKFPPEIRNKVYANLLCSFGEQEEQPKDEEEHEVVIETDQVGNLAHTAILLANRQIHHEAKDVMLRQNQFVRIFIRDIRAPKYPGRIIVHSAFPAQDPIVRNFKGAVMSYYVKDKYGTQTEHCCRCHGMACDLIVLAKDLDGFLRAFAGPDNHLPSLPTSTENCIILHDPFKISTNPNYDLVKYQRSLLQPFQNHFSGFTKVEIKGKVGKELAKAVMKDIMNEVLPVPDMFLEEVTNLKNKGNNFFREGRSLDALRMWRWGIFKLLRLRYSNMWSRIGGQLGVEFLDSLAQLYFTLHSNAAQHCLQHMHKLHEDSEIILTDLSIVECSAHYAMMAGEVFGSTWQPSARQEAKVVFRYAQAARLAGELALAHSLIGTALDLQPNDHSIVREAAEIRRRWLQMNVDVQSG